MIAKSKPVFDRRSLVMRALLGRLPLVLSVLWLIGACSEPTEQQLVTIADALTSPARVVDVGQPGDSVGDLVMFDQPLLSATGEPVGTNSGFCVRTQLGKSYQCQWTLIMAEGSIQVAGREFDEGESYLSIVGGTGIFRHIAGEMTSRKNASGNFVQTLHFR